MAASSLSAPAFSLEDQARELQSLTLEERMKVEVDTLGYHSNGTFSLSDDEGDSPVANKSDTTQEHLLLEQFEEHLQQAMKQRQASSSKNDVTKEPYLEALLENPETVEREAPPLFFLRREGNDIQAAVEALLTYWRIRKSVFGAEVFHKPVGKLLTKEDLQTLRTGFLMQMPNDSHGRPVLYYDPSRVYKLSNRSNRTVRCVFITCTMVAAQDPSHQRNGFVAVHNEMMERPELFDRRTCRRIKEILFCLPMKLRCTHAIISREQQNTLWMSVIHPIFLFLLGKELRLRYKVHCYHRPRPGSSHTTKNAVLVELEKYGLQSENLPSMIGGTWKTKEFDEWLDSLMKD